MWFALGGVYLYVTINVRALLYDRDAVNATTFLSRVGVGGMRSYGPAIPRETTTSFRMVRNSIAEMRWC